MDLSDCRLKVDHFDQMHGLGEEMRLEGAPNFRQLTGFPIFGTGQPTEEGFKKVLEKVTAFILLLLLISLMECK